MSAPAEGWGTSPATGRPTFTMHGSSVGVTPPALDGYEPSFIARHGSDYTTWTYRPVTS